MKKLIYSLFLVPTLCFGDFLEFENIGTSASSGGGGSGNTVNPMVTNFVTLSGITSPSTISDLNNIIQVHGSKTNELVDIIALSSRFNPSNQITLMGRSWTTPSTVAGQSPIGQPIYGDWQGAICYGTNGIELVIPALTNFTIGIVYFTPPSIYTVYDDRIVHGGIDLQFCQPILCNLIGADGSGDWIDEETSAGGGGGNCPFIYPRIGPNTNQWYNNGWNWILGSSGVQGTNGATFESTLVSKLYNSTIRHTLVVTYDTGGHSMMYLDGMQSLFNYKNVKTNVFTSTVSNTTPMTVLHIGADTNVNWSLAFGGAASFYARTNSFEEFQAIFLYNASDSNLVPIIQTAGLYVNPKRSVYTHYGPSIWDENQMVSAGSSVATTSVCTNTMIGTLQLENPNILFQNVSQGGGSVILALTNSDYGNTTIPLTTALAVPSVGFVNIVGSDLERNDIYNGLVPETMTNINMWTAQLFNPLRTNGIPLWYWNEGVVGTNGATYTVTNASAYVQYNQSAVTNRLFAHVVFAGRHVTNRSYTNSSPDSTHCINNGETYADMASEFNGLGSITLFRPDTYTVVSVTGFTNLTMQTMSALMTVGTSVQFFEPDGTQWGPTTTIASGIFECPCFGPLWSCRGTSITATFVDNPTQ